MNTETFVIIVIIVLVLLAMLTYAYSVFLDSPDSEPMPIFPKRQWRANFWQGISTEFFGAALITFLLTLMFGSMQQSEQNFAYRASLLRDLASSDNGTALRAVDLLREESWWTDGTLNNLNLLGSDLRNADLSGGNLKGVNLRFADLRGASLLRTNLQNADLRYALLQQFNTRTLLDVDEVRADLLPDLLSFDSINSLAGIALQQAFQYASPANFDNADLRFANFKSSDLSFSSMRGAVLLDADFSDSNMFMVDLREAVIVENLSNVIVEGSNNPEAFREVGGAPIFNRGTLLPNGSTWSSRTDMTHFVDTSHPGYADIEICRAFAFDPANPDLVPPISCGLIWQTLPYPQPQPGPFRESAGE